MASTITPNPGTPGSTTAAPFKEPMVIHTRSNRFHQRGGTWFLATDEGTEIGPFNDKAEAQMALLYFVEYEQWPTPKQLREYIRRKNQ